MGEPTNQHVIAAEAKQSICSCGKNRLVSDSQPKQALGFPPLCLFHPPFPSLDGREMKEFIPSNHATGEEVGREAPECHLSCDSDGVLHTANLWYFYHHRQAERSPVRHPGLARKASL
jgi:hypothetical protein